MNTPHNVRRMTSKNYDAEAYEIAHAAIEQISIDGEGITNHLRELAVSLDQLDKSDTVDTAYIIDMRQKMLTITQAATGLALVLTDLLDEIQLQQEDALGAASFPPIH